MKGQGRGERPQGPPRGSGRAGRAARGRPRGCPDALPPPVLRNNGLACNSQRHLAGWTKRPQLRFPWKEGRLRPEGPGAGGSGPLCRPATSRGAPPPGLPHHPSHVRVQRGLAPSLAQTPRDRSPSRAHTRHASQPAVQTRQQRRLSSVPATSTASRARCQAPRKPRRDPLRQRLGASPPLRI